MIAVIQLDGLGEEPLERLLDAGRLPNLAAFLDAAPRRPLSTPAPDLPAAVYPTLYSGEGPGRHGLFYPFQWVPSEQRVAVADRQPHPPMLWDRLASGGARCLVADPYECVPPSGPCASGSVVLSGIQLSERVVLRRWSRPRSAWMSAARGLGGAPPRATETFGPSGERARELLTRALVAAPARVARLAEREASGGWDLAWFSLISPHLGGHRLWGLPALDDVYAATDAALGRILAALPAEATPVLVCPIGMGPDTARADLLPGMLARVLDPPAAASSAADPGSVTDSGAMWRLRAALPTGLRGAVAGALPAPVARRLTARLELRGVDWSTTRAFAHPSDNQGYVRLNLRGREREGIVEPADARALVEEIEAGLRTFTDSEGRPVVEDCVPGGEYRGPRAAELPDLIVRWSRGSGELGVAHAPRFGTVRRRGAGSGRTGNHTPDGAWVAGDVAPDVGDLPGFTAALVAAVRGGAPVRGGSDNGAPVMVGS